MTSLLHPLDQRRWLRVVVTVKVDGHQMNYRHSTPGPRNRHRGGGVEMMWRMVQLGEQTG
jgi:hypothetical protein